MRQTSRSRRAAAAAAATASTSTSSNPANNNISNAATAFRAQGGGGAQSAVGSRPLGDTAVGGMGQPSGEALGFMIVLGTSSFDAPL